MPKISALTALTSTGIASDDVFPLVDTSATATKKLAASGLLQAALLAASSLVLDTNGNELLAFTTTGSAVNEVTIANAATGSAPVISATGGDTNIGLTLTSKGSGIVRLSSTTLGFPSAGILADVNGNELLKFGSTVASAVNELTLTNAATGDPVLLAATGGDTNIGIKIDSKGSGTIALQATGTGNVTSAVPIVVTSASANALTVGRQGTTNPGFQVDASTATNVTGVKITPAAAAAGVDVSVISSGTNENLTVNAKGSGTITFNPTGTGNVVLGVTTLQFPSAGIVADANGNELLKFAATVASAVNELTLTNAATGNPVLLAATGGDTNVGVSVDGKGTGKIILNGTGTGNVRVGTNLELLSAASIVDANGNEIIKTAATVASAVNELTVTNSATGNPVLLAATGGDTNVGVRLDAKGSGTIALNTTGTGNVTSAVPVVVTSASANALAVGRQGTTNPGLLVDASTATNVTGVKITPAAAAAGVAIAVISSGTDESATVDAKGAGTISLNATATGNVIVGTNLQHGSAKAIVDANGNESIKFPATVGSAVNEFTVSNAATAGAPTLAATGGDTNISVDLVPKGTGIVRARALGLQKVTQTAVTDTATLTIAQLLTGIIDGTPTAAADYTLPTAAALVAGIPNARVGDSFSFLINNKSAGANTITVLAGGATLDGTVTVAQNVIRRFTVIVTNVTGASEAYFVYGEGA